MPMEPISLALTNDEKRKRPERAAIAAAKAGKELRNKMTQQEIWKQWIKIANDQDATIDAIYSVEGKQRKMLIASLLSAAYWHPLNKRREYRDPHFEGLCDAHRCANCPRALTNGICWHPTSDYWAIDYPGKGRPTKKTQAQIDKMFTVALDEYKKLLP